MNSAADNANLNNNAASSAAIMNSAANNANLNNNAASSAASTLTTPTSTTTPPAAPRRALHMEKNADGKSVHAVKMSHTHNANLNNNAASSAAIMACATQSVHVNV
jgi:hypothetical protein